MIVAAKRNLLMSLPARLLIYMSCVSQQEPVFESFEQCVQNKEISED